MNEPSDIRQGTIRANDLDFAFIEAGEGPLVLLLHGFPDNPWTWSHQLPALAASGYRAVAPFLRGYAPTQMPSDGRYDPAALADDVAGLVDALGDGPAFVIGNDWGAISTSAAPALHPQAGPRAGTINRGPPPPVPSTPLPPEPVRRAVTITVGHPATFLSTLLHPRQIHHIFHFWFFQLGPLAVEAVKADDMAFVDYLWDYWSAEGHSDREHVERVKSDT